MTTHGTTDAIAVDENSAGDNSANTDAGPSVRRLGDVDSRPARHNSATTVFAPHGRRLQFSTQVCDNFPQARMMY